VFEHHHTAADLSSIAVHEAGHAVTASRLGLPVISIEIRGGSDGLDGWCKVDYSRARPSAWVTVLMAGWAAEEVIIGARAESRPHVGSDTDVIADALTKVTPGQRWALIATATQHARRMVQSHRNAIVGLAQLLLDNAAMTGSAWDTVDIHIYGERLFEALGGAATAILRKAI
jgi:ATP-dependent Zn protease